VTRVETRASCTLEMVGGAAKITKIELVTRGKVPGIDQAGVHEGGRVGGSRTAPSRRRCRATLTSASRRSWCDALQQHQATRKKRPTATDRRALVAPSRNDTAPNTERPEHRRRLAAEGVETEHFGSFPGGMSDAIRARLAA